MHCIFGGLYAIFLLLVWRVISVRCRGFSGRKERENCRRYEWRISQLLRYHPMPLHCSNLSTIEADFGKSLIIDNVHPEDAGVYQCKAGTITHKITVDVEGEHYIHTLHTFHSLLNNSRFFDFFKPRRAIIAWSKTEKFRLFIVVSSSIPHSSAAPYWENLPPDDIELPEADEAELRCLAGGKPAPLVQWTQNGKPLHGREEIVVDRERMETR